jgi:hypothetical protein
VRGPADSTELSHDHRRRLACIKIKSVANEFWLISDRDADAYLARLDGRFLKTYADDLDQNMRSEQTSATRNSATVKASLIQKVLIRSMVARDIGNSGSEAIDSAMSRMSQAKREEYVDAARKLMKNSPPNASTSVLARGPETVVSRNGEAASGVHE